MFRGQSIQRFLRIRGTNTCPDGRRRLDANGKAASRTPTRTGGCGTAWKATPRRSGFGVGCTGANRRTKNVPVASACAPSFPTRFAGFALTVALKKEANHDSEALKGMLAAIDQGAPKFRVRDGRRRRSRHLPEWGGLMGTAMSVRNFSGAVIDGGVRDVALLAEDWFSGVRAGDRAFYFNRALPFRRIKYPCRL